MSFTEVSKKSRHSRLKLPYQAFAYPIRVGCLDRVLLSQCLWFGLFPRISGPNLRSLSRIKYFGLCSKGGFLIAERSTHRWDSFVIRHCTILREQFYNHKSVKLAEENISDISNRGTRFLVKMVLKKSTPVLIPVVLSLSRTFIYFWTVRFSDFNTSLSNSPLIRSSPGFWFSAANFVWSEPQFQGANLWFGWLWFRLQL